MTPPGAVINLPESLSRRAAAGSRPALLFLSNGRAETAGRTYGELDSAARAVAAELLAAGAAGRPVLLCFPPGLEFVESFLGCLYAGAIAVPTYSLSPASLKRAFPRLLAIAADCRAPVGLTTAEHAAALGELAPEGHPLRAARWIPVSGLRPRGGASPGPVDPASGAMIQYTSGSTSRPKGVLLTHGNLAAQQEMIRRAFGHDEGSDVVSWLPPYHDMGLIGNILQPLTVGARAVLMPPRAFLARPRRWWEAVTRYRPTSTGGPNFAYDLCLQRIDEGELRGLDLSSLEIAYNGSEAVRAGTLERFAARFSRCGLRREALYPCYGLAEASLLVAGPPKGRGPLFARLDPEALRRGVARVVAEGGREVSGSGRPLPELSVRIADHDSGAPCAPGGIGEVWVKGASVAAGYWGRPALTDEAFGARFPDGDGPYLRTGDLGFLHEGELFLTGRIKDTIVLQGRNHAPEDLELCAQGSHPRLRPHGCAAFSVEQDGGERVVIVAEAGAMAPEERAQAAEEIGRRVREEHGVAAEVVLVRGGALPKTSSGKLMRGACREAFLAGRLAILL